MAEDTRIPPQGDLFTAKGDPGDSAVSRRDGARLDRAERPARTALVPIGPGDVATFGGAALSAEGQDVDFASYLASHGEGADNGDGADGLMVGGLPPTPDAADDLSVGDDLLSGGTAPDLFLLSGDRAGDQASRDPGGAWIGRDEDDLERAGGDASSDPGAAFDLTDNMGVLVIDDARPARPEQRNG
ncbi:hypothetical protein [Rhodospirillum rubrum]|uniref:hypothetical protein n=1 Tax=Rhodospirillum rubrum TaxID=1085 RepID=UPI001F5B333D|nr:hypothetical protein [Rhodospirillum rubrum]